VHVAGIDLSITNAGVARIRQTGDAAPVIATRNVLSSPGKTGEADEHGKATETLLDRRQRLQSIAFRVVNFVKEGYDPDTDGPMLVAIEAPLYRAPMRRDPNTGNMIPITGGGHAHDRAGVWWLVTHTLFKLGFVVEVSTTVLKSYASGKGSGRKLGVMAAMPYMFPDLFVDDDNVADALVLAAMAARQLGSPVEPSPQRVHPAAMNSVKWPSFTQLK
jgi:crossover junction endodeoxyribonuclease RuvC